jgi:hypothetical protein
MFEHIVELQRKLQEARNNETQPLRYRQRTAAMNDARKLLMEGNTVRQVANYLGPSVISLSEVEAEQERIERRRNEGRPSDLEILTQRDIPGSMAHFSILQR